MKDSIPLRATRLVEQSLLLASQSYRVTSLVRSRAPLRITVGLSLKWSSCRIGEWLVSPGHEEKKPCTAPNAACPIELLRGLLCFSKTDELVGQLTNTLALVPKTVPKICTLGVVYLGRSTCNTISGRGVSQLGFRTVE